MQAAVLYVATNPQVYSKLMPEIIAAEAAGTISHPIKYQEALRLPYLQAVIKESLRIYAPAGCPMPRLVPPGGARFCGFFIPEGTWIEMSHWALNRRKETYGEDADLFRPERWLEDEERARAWEKADMNWGAGYCTCLGKNIALMEINKTVVEVTNLPLHSVPELFRRL